MSQRAWKIASASSIGTSHVGTGTPCQDACEHALISTGDGPVLVCVVCDGAGSAAHSDVGSSLAARTFVELTRMHFEAGRLLPDIDRATAAMWLEKIAETLEIHAAQFGRAVRDYACTLLAVVAGEATAAFIQVGDGAIVVSHGVEDGWSWVFWPQHGEFANTTNFVVSPTLSNVFEFDIVPRRVDEVAVFSDGIENLVLHNATRTVHQPFFEGVFQPLRLSTANGFDAKLSNGLRLYLDTPQFNERTDDDKTLALASRSFVATTPTP